MKEDLRAFAPLLGVIAAALLAVVVFLLRMASWGKNIQEATHANRRAAGGRGRSGGQPG